jgi:hypothetical protein
MSERHVPHDIRHRADALLRQRPHGMHRHSGYGGKGESKVGSWHPRR